MTLFNPRDLTAPSGASQHSSASYALFDADILPLIEFGLPASADTCLTESCPVGKVRPDLLCKAIA
jgi:hypothetical protein